MPAFDLKGKMELDGSAVSRQFKRTTQEADGFRKTMGAKLKELGGGFLSGALGIVGFGALKASLKSFIDQAKGVAKLAKDLHISTDEAQALSIYADQSGESIEALTATSEKLEETLMRLRTMELPPLLTKEQIDNVSIFDRAMEDIWRRMKSATVTTFTSEDADGSMAGAAKAGVKGFKALFLDEGSINEEDALIAKREREFIRTQEAERKAEEEKVKQTLEVEKRINETTTKADESEAKLKDARLTDAEKLLKIESEIAAMKAEKTMAAVRGDNLSFQQLRDQIADAEFNQLRLSERTKDKVPAKDDEDIAALPSPSGNADALTRVGGFTFGAGVESKQTQLIAEMARELKTHREILRQIERNSKDGIGM